MKPKVVISGYGAVGKALHKIFPDAQIYDPPLGFKDKKVLNNTEFNFICVQTPSLDTGGCDTSIVEELLEWSGAEINIVRSTVWPGFTKQRLLLNKDKKIIFMPEYGPSDFKGHPFNNLEDVGWAILGGDPDISVKVAELLRTALYKLKIFYTDPTTAEVTKLVENAYLYTKVIFFQQMYDLCKGLDVNFDEMRLYLTEDPRINEDHTYVYPSRRKVGGPCLPKDMDNLIKTLELNNLNTKFFKMLKELNEDL